MTLHTVSDQLREQAPIVPLIEERRKNPKDDVLSQLIHDEVDGASMTPEQVKSNVAIMFTAGSSTTQDSIRSLAYGVATTEDYWAQARGHPELRANAIEEALRWEPAVSFLPRLSKRDGATPCTSVYRTSSYWSRSNRLRAERSFGNQRS